VLRADRGPRWGDGAQRSNTVTTSDSMICDRLDRSEAMKPQRHARIVTEQISRRSCSTGRLISRKIMPHDAALYAVLRNARIWVAYLFLRRSLTHVGAAPFHTWCAMTACCRR